MFQNITRDSLDNQNEYNEESKKVSAKDVLKRLFAKQNIMLYIITFMISMVEALSVLVAILLAIIKSPLLK